LERGLDGWYVGWVDVLSDVLQEITGSDLSRRRTKVLCNVKEEDAEDGD